MISVKNAHLTRLVRTVLSLLQQLVPFRFILFRRSVVPCPSATKSVIVLPSSLGDVFDLNDYHMSTSASGEVTLRGFHTVVVVNLRRFQI